MVNLNLILLISISSSNNNSQLSNPSIFSVLHQLMKLLRQMGNLTWMICLVVLQQNQWCKTKQLTIFLDFIHSNLLCSNNSNLRPWLSRHQILSTLISIIMVSISSLRTNSRLNSNNLLWTSSVNHLHNLSSSSSLRGKMSYGKILIFIQQCSSSLKGSIIIHLNE